MREILFRGKCVDTGMWYEGGYIHLHKTTHCPIGDPERFPDNDIHQIVFERMTDWELPNQHYRVDVDPKTVGQFTGLTDKNGKKIFEGDIVRVLGNQQVEDWKNVDYIGSIAFLDAGFCVIDGTIEDHAFRRYQLPRLALDLEVIGNIHDNPELLEVE